MENNSFDFDIKILYQDDFLVIVNKPANWLVHRSWLDHKEQKILMQKVRDQIGKHVYTVHRLDKPTSGVLVMTLDPHSASIMSKQFEENTVKKKYHALVRGYITQSGVVDYPLTVIRDKIADKHSATDKLPQEAITNYAPITYYEVPIVNSRHTTTRYTLMELVPFTGRKHQLRRHMAHLRHPIMGDTTHGDLKQNRAFAAFFGQSRLMLHASEIEFQHPEDLSLIKISSPYSEDFDFKDVITAIAPFKVLLS